MATRIPRTRPDPDPLLDRLNDRQRRFVLAYMRRAHATEAAAGAGYAWPDKQGSRLKSHPAVRAAIDALTNLYAWERWREIERRWAEERRAPAPTGRRRRRRRKPIGGR